MPETSNQEISQPLDGIQSNALLQRLDRRRTQPVGVIHSQRSHTQNLPDTIVQRAALTNQLQTRYAVQDSEAANAQLALANPISSDSEPATDTFSPVTRSVTRSMAEIAKTTPNSASVGTGTEQTNIQRTPTDTLSTVARSIAAISKTAPEKPSSYPGSSPTLIQRATTTDSSDSGGNRSLSIPAAPSETSSTTVVPPAPAGQFRVRRKVPPLPVSSESPSSLRAKPDSPSSKPSISNSGTASKPLNIATQQDPASAMQSIPEPFMPLFKTSHSKPSTKFSGQVQLQRSPSSSTFIQRAGEDAPGSPSYLEPILPGRDDVAAEPSRRYQERLPVHSNLPPGGAGVYKEILPIVQAPDQQPVPIEENYFEAFKAASTELSALEAAQSRPVQTRRELPPELLSAHSIQPPALPVETSVIEPSQSAQSEPDIEQIAEQVSRILFHKLRVERERRGTRR